MIATIGIGPEAGTVFLGSLRRLASRTRRGAGPALVAALVAFAMPVAAQEGFPLKGSWLGTWSHNTVHGDNVLVVLDWDGKNITGTINPGTDNIPITKASLDPNGWVVKIEADAKDKTGAPIHYTIEGMLKDLELPTRSVVGTWSSQRGHGDFEISRQ